MKKKRFNKKGMTLIEVIVGLMICAIFAAIGIAVLGPVNNTYSSVEQKSEAQQIAKTLMESIRGETNTCRTLLSTDNRIAYSDTKDADLTKDPGLFKIIFVGDDGYLRSCKYEDFDSAVTSGSDEDKSELVYDGDYYNGKTISMTAAPYTKSDGTAVSNKIKITVKVYKPKDTDTVLAEVTDAVLYPILNAQKSGTTDTNDIGENLSRNGVGSSTWGNVLQDVIRTTSSNYETRTVKAGAVFSDENGVYGIMGYNRVIRKIDAQKPKNKNSITAYNNSSSLSKVIVILPEKPMTVNDISSTWPRQGSMLLYGGRLYVWIGGYTNAYISKDPVNNPESWVELINPGSSYFE